VHKSPTRGQEVVIEPDVTSGDDDEGSRRNPLDKAVMVLRWIVDQDNENWGVREIARGLNVAPSTVHRVLSSLESQQLVRVDPVTGRYSLGLEFLRLAWKTMARWPLRTAALPLIRRLAENTGETAFLAVYDPARRQMMFVATIESLHELRAVVPLNTWVAFNPSASALAILAFLPPRDRNAILRQMQTVAKGQIDTGALRQQLGAAARSGYIMTVGQRNPHAVGVAAPIFNAIGEVIGDVGLAIPKPHFQSKQAVRLADEVTTAARAITTQFGGTWIGHIPA
jgi:DNA-binding IclR family transcriptional regulator